MADLSAGAGDDPNWSPEERAFVKRKRLQRRFGFSSSKVRGRPKPKHKRTHYVKLKAAALGLDPRAVEANTPRMPKRARFGPRKRDRLGRYVASPAARSPRTPASNGASPE